MPERPAWRIYYRDGRTYDSLDGSWDDAPTEGVLAVVESDGHRRETHAGHDHYQLDSGAVVLRDARTIIANVGRVPMSRVKFGWYTSPQQMEAVHRRIREEWA